MSNLLYTEKLGSPLIAETPSIAGAVLEDNARARALHALESLALIPSLAGRRRWRLTKYKLSALKSDSRRGYGSSRFHRESRVLQTESVPTRRDTFWRDAEALQSADA